MLSKSIKLILATSIVLSLFFPLATRANETAESHRQQVNQAYQRAINAATVGAKTITLSSQARFYVPQNLLFIPKKQATELMRALGNKHSEDLIGMVVSSDPASDWLIKIDYIPAGYIKDGDAKTWQADKMLARIKKNTESENGWRKQQGFPPVFVRGWVEKPNYNKTTHRLIWSLLLDSNDGGESMVNYNTYALGREGFFSVDLVAPRSSINSYKFYAHKVLSAIEYIPGKRYQDFSPQTDKVAKYGLAALITGVAAKKLGLFAMLSVLLLKIGKFLLILPILLWNKIKKLFTKSANDNSI